MTELRKYAEGQVASLRRGYCEFRRIKWENGEVVWYENAPDTDGYEKMVSHTDRWLELEEQYQEECAGPSRMAQDIASATGS